ncbi:hypothetical protein D3C72_994110 [compost metagenome]
MRTLGLLFLVGLLLLRQALGPGALEGGVAAFVQVQLALLDVQHMVDHGIEEVAVVGDQQQRAGVALEPVLQPQDSVQVQVVGGLVEQQQVGRAHQGLGQVQAHPPATGEVADAAVHLFVGETKAGQQLACAGVGGIAVGAIQLNVQARQGGTVVGLLGRGQFGLDLAQAHVAVEHIVHGQAVEGIDLLAHVSDAPVTGQLAIAGIGRQLTAQQGEQAGFSGAVGADQAGLVTGVQGHLGAF